MDATIDPNANPGAGPMAEGDGRTRLDRPRLAEGIWCGGGLSPAETKVLREEMRAIRARNPLNSFGISMLGRRC